MLFVSPRSGLGNRLRALDSAIALARDVGPSQLALIWRLDRYLNCRFHWLFEVPREVSSLIHISSGGSGALGRLRHAWSDPEDVLREGVLRRLFCRTIHNKEAHELAPRGVDFWQAMARGKSLVVDTCYRFYPNQEAYAWLKPTQALERRIEKTTGAFGEYVVGVHIRRTDHVRSIELSPDELFFEKMDGILKVHPEARFFLATDSPETRRTFQERYGLRILGSETEVLDRNQPEGILSAAVEMLILSRCNLILASASSSFSTTAAQIGHVESQVVSLAAGGP